MIVLARECLPDLPLFRMCQLLRLSRSLVYRPLADRDKEGEEETILIAAIDRIVLRFPGYGYRRVTAQLVRDGFCVNHKRVLRLMREQGLLCRARRQWIKTTDSDHGLTVYPNRLKGVKARDLSALNEVWVADITYVRLGDGSGFCYVAAILDAFSRRVVGWHISREIDAALVLAALEKALEARRPNAGFVHHSDRGVQYACRGYVERLEKAGARISMSRKACPRDNAQAESFFRTLKVEEVYLQEYRNFAHASACVGQFIEAVYNQERLHSALGYLPPAEFEEKIKEAANYSGYQTSSR
jgi:putative transposase